MDDDIVERLKREARNLNIKCTCNMVDPIYAIKICSNCIHKKLLWEAAKEIEEMRSLYEVVKK